MHAALGERPWIAALAQARSRWVEHVHAYRLLADDALLAGGLDITPALLAAASVPLVSST
jgi:hypothetical protein